MISSESQLRGILRGKSPQEAYSFLHLEEVRLVRVGRSTQKALEAVRTVREEILRSLPEEAVVSK